MKNFFDIRIAKRETDHEDVMKLVSEMYEWRGYKVDEKHSFEENHNKITLISRRDETLLGSFTMTFDHTDEKLHSDQMYHELVQSLRDSDKRICEISRLAVSKDINSKKYIAFLFSILFCHVMQREYTSIIIEVNPRHEDYYKKMLGFQTIASGNCDRVDAPGILMVLDLSHAESEIIKCSGSTLSKNRKSLYHLFLSPEEISKVINGISSGELIKINHEEHSFAIIN